jgi:hypothetical protein
MASDTRALAQVHERRTRRQRFAVRAVAALVLGLTFTAGPVAPTLAADEPDPAETSGGGHGGGGHGGGGHDKDVVLLGDSLAALAFGWLGGPTSDAPEQLLSFFAAGWTLRDAVSAAGDALDARSTDVVVISVGPNDAAPWDDGWTRDDVSYWRHVLGDIPERTCVAIVLPGWTSQLADPAWVHGMEQMRRDARRLVADRRSAGAPTLTVDWQQVIDAHPTYIHTDGIHIANTEAATALQRLYWDAADQCRHHHAG